MMKKKKIKAKRKKINIYQKKKYFKRLEIGF
jgi:hypothetical protein